MVLTDLVAYASIRAALQLSAKELKDTVLADELYWNTLVLEFHRINSGLLADVETTLAKLIPTATETLFLLAAKSFAAYFVANLCLDATVNLSPRSVASGKTMFIRHTADAVTDIQAKVSQRLTSFRSALESIYSEYKGGGALAVVVPTLAIAAAPDFDPVTGA